MVDRPYVIALIPARGGSKGIKRKNIRSFGGHPLIAYSIASALASKTVSRVIVSTDDPEIAETARKYGAETPFLRPRALAGDHTTDYPVFKHALSWLRVHEGGRVPDIFVQLRPTSPLRPKGLIDKAVKLLASDKNVDSVRCVTPSGQNPYKMWRLDPGGRLMPLIRSSISEPYNAPRQKLPKTYWQTGHIDVVKIRTLERARSMTGKRVLPVFVDPEFCIDIDTEVDLRAGEARLSRLGTHIDRPAGGRAWPKKLELLVFDFDGVFTDNKVRTDQNGIESVVCDRSDGLGIKYVRQLGIPMIVLSTETNPCVAARCRKLKVRWLQGLEDKAGALRRFARDHRIELKNVVYLGNDLNDLGCFQAAGLAVAVADSHPGILGAADLVLGREGGRGAVRELCDMVVEKYRRRKNG